MAITYVEIEDCYITKTANKPITVYAEIGDAQKGGYLIFLDQKLKGNNAPAVIGVASEVQEQWTIISATVIDVMDQTNWTSLTITITEDSYKKVYGPYSKQVSNDLDTVCYIIKILNTHE